MPQATIAGRTIELDGDGCLVDAADWYDDVAAEIAARAGIAELTDAHWRVVDFVRQRYLRGEHPPTCRLISRECAIPVRSLFRLFPGGPVRVAAKVAGVPEPHHYVGGCGVNWLSRWR